MRLSINIKQLPEHRYRILSLILCAVIVFMMFPMSTSPVLAEVDDIIHWDVSSHVFEDENGDSIQIFIADPFHNDDCIARICEYRPWGARTLYNYSDRVESYEAVIKEICARPLLHSGSIKARAAEVLAKTDIPFEMWDTITNAVEYVGLNKGEEIKALANAKKFSEQMKAVFLKIKDGDNPHFDDNPIYEAVGLAVADVQATLVFVDLHFATILYDLLATEEAQCRLDLLKTLTPYIEDDAWQEALNNVQISAELSEMGYWGKLINVIDDKKGEIAAGAVSLFSALSAINIKWKLLLLEFKVIMAISNQEELVQTASIAATVHNYLKEYGDSSVYGTRQLLEYAQIAFYDYMILACDTLLGKWKDLLSPGHFWKDMADDYTNSKKICLSMDSALGPSISVITPIDGTTVTGETQFTVQVDDNIGVAYVELKAAGEIIDDPATPDVEGLFLPPTCEEVFPAEYTVHWTPTDYSGSVTIEATAFDAAGNQANQRISLIVDTSPRLSIGLKPGSVEKGTSYVISGVLTDANLAPLEAVTVSAKTSSSFIGSDETDADGQYSIAAIAPNAPGSHDVTVEAMHNGKVATASDQLIVTDPTAGHDVAVRSFELDAYYVPPGHTINLKATFDNEGEVPEDFVANWYIYPPDSSTPADSELDVPYGNHGPGGTTGEVGPVPLKTDSREGTWTAKVWLRLDNDADPGDNQWTLPFYVGEQPEINRYRVEDFARHWDSTSPAIVCDYSVKLGQWYWKNGRYYVADFYWTNTKTGVHGDIRVRLGDYDKVDGDQLVVFFTGGQFYAGGQGTFELWCNSPGTSFNFDATTRNGVVPRGERPIYRVTSSNELDGWRIAVNHRDDGQTVGLDDSTTVYEWTDDYKNTDKIDSQTWDLIFEVPLEAPVDTYTFWMILEFSEFDAAQKLELEVLSEHDASVSNLDPPNESHHDPGDIVEISATVAATGGYTEHPNVTLSITSTNGYSYTEGKRVSVTGSQSVSFSSWDTAGLQPGEYTITVNALIGEDANGGNDSSTSIVHIDEPPPLSIVAASDSTSHYQGDTVGITANVTNDGSVTDANTVANITWPDDSHTCLAMAYDGSLEAYICQFTASQQGTYSVSVMTSKAGYSDGSYEIAGIDVINKEPDTRIFSAYPIYSGWSRQAEVTFKWEGSDTGTAQSDLLYTWKLDDGSWNSYSNNVSTTLTSLSEGQHTFQVKAYDGTLEDATPASWPFSVDVQIPSVIITTNNGDDFLTDLSQLTLQGTASDAVPGSGLAEVLVEGGWDNDGTVSNWSFEVNLQAGENILTVIGMDGAGNIATDSIAINSTATTDLPSIIVPEGSIAYNVKGATHRVEIGFGDWHDDWVASLVEIDWWLEAGVNLNADDITVISPAGPNPYSGNVSYAETIKTKDAIDNVHCIEIRSMRVGDIHIFVELMNNRTQEAITLHTEKKWGEINCTELTSESLGDNEYFATELVKAAFIWGAPDVYEVFPTGDAVVRWWLMDVDALTDADNLNGGVGIEDVETDLGDDPCDEEGGCGRWTWDATKLPEDQPDDPFNHISWLQDLYPVDHATAFLYDGSVGTTIDADQDYATSTTGEDGTTYIGVYAASPNTVLLVTLAEYPIDYHGENVECVQHDITVTGELNPHFVVDKIEVAVGETVTFDPTSTYGGSLPYTRIRWDFEGDGVWDVDSSGNWTSATLPIATWSYDAEGEYHPCLEITDSSIPPMVRAECMAPPFNITVTSEERVYLDPQDSSAPFCKTEPVEVWVNATDFQAGQIKLIYGPTCADVTNWERNEDDFPLGTWDSDTPGEEWITFSAIGPLTGDYLIGKLTIHCIFEGECTTTLEFIEDGATGSALFDDTGSEIPAIWEDGTFECILGVCGDVAPYDPGCDGIVNMGDVVLLLNYVGHPGQYELCCESAGDVAPYPDCDGIINMGDVVLLLNYVGHPGELQLCCE